MLELIDNCEEEGEMKEVILLLLDFYDYSFIFMTILNLKVFVVFVKH